jgi:hypothetical protein
MGAARRREAPLPENAAGAGQLRAHRRSRRRSAGIRSSIQSFQLSYGHGRLPGIGMKAGPCASPWNAPCRNRGILGKSSARVDRGSPRSPQVGERPRQFHAGAAKGAGGFRAEEEVSSLSASAITASARMANCCERRRTCRIFMRFMFRGFDRNLGLGVYTDGTPTRQRPARGRTRVVFVGLGCRV